jgi:hypothetical protein
MNEETAKAFAAFTAALQADMAKDHEQTTAGEANVAVDECHCCDGCPVQVECALDTHFSEVILDAEAASEIIEALAVTLMAVAKVHGYPEIGQAAFDAWFNARGEE